MNKTTREHVTNKNKILKYSAKGILRWSAGVFMVYRTAVRRGELGVVGARPVGRSAGVALLSLMVVVVNFPTVRDPSPGEALR